MENVLLSGNKGILILVMVEGKSMSTWTISRTVSVKVAGGLMWYIDFRDSTISCS